MKGSVIIKVVIASVLFIMMSCSRTEGSIELINRTSHNLYYAFENENVNILEPGVNGVSKITRDFKIGDGFLIFGKSSKEIKFYAEGETYALYSGDEKIVDYVSTIQKDKTTRAYFDPYYAGVKLINNSGQEIISLYMKNTKGINGPEVFDYNLLSEALSAGDFFFEQLVPSDESNRLVYGFKVIKSDGEEIEYSYDSPDLILEIDEVFVIDLTFPANY
ncbi:MAG: hypothetical protein PHR06_12505 [Candidatus Cloacimonetes bacterium]|nr:hypothetical protein [Candidatus Cloacimonadota bacterium]